MAKKRSFLGKSRILPGTLNMLILQVLEEKQAHGFEILQRIKMRSENILIPEEGSLYPALHRLESEGFLLSQWQKTENNRRAKFYSISPIGQQQLGSEVQAWKVAVDGINKILGWEI